MEFDDAYSYGESIADKISKEVKAQLHQYFKKERKQFELKLQPAGTPFQQQVWHNLQLISYGKTITYQQQAVQLGDVKSIRASANANGKNPIAIIIPCHRVIGSNGQLTGYAGGLWRKEKLLALESGMVQQELF
jgi:methylated-DNA-[protein]-cysteine S-methyltransferase